MFNDSLVFKNGIIYLEVKKQSWVVKKASARRLNHYKIIDTSIRIPIFSWHRLHDRLLASSFWRERHLRAKNGQIWIQICRQVGGIQRAKKY